MAANDAVEGKGDRGGRGGDDKKRSVGRARYSRAAWMNVASCSVDTALATFRFPSTGSTTMKGSVNLRAAGVSNSIRVPSLHDPAAARTPRNVRCLRTKSSHKYPENPRIFASAPYTPIPSAHAFSRRTSVAWSSARCPRT